MLRLPILTLAIASGVMLSACASAPLTPPMALPAPVPWECVARCPEPPKLMAPRETWELQVLDWGLQCKALHDDCVSALTKKATNAN